MTAKNGSPAADFEIYTAFNPATDLETIGCYPLKAPDFVAERSRKNAVGKLRTIYERMATMHRVIENIQRYLIPLLFMLIGIIAANKLMSADSSADEESARGVATLEERLLNGLRARTDAERDYVKQVVTYVQQGKLPAKLVDSTFLWVRKNKANNNYPIFYFKSILESRAKTLNLEVPDLKIR